MCWLPRQEAEWTQHLLCISSQELLAQTNAETHRSTRAVGQQHALEVLQRGCACNDKERCVRSLLGRLRSGGICGCLKSLCPPELDPIGRQLPSQRGSLLVLRLGGLGPAKSVTGSDGGSLKAGGLTASACEVRKMAVCVAAFSLVGRHLPLQRGSLLVLRLGSLGTADSSCD